MIHRSIVAYRQARQMAEDTMRRHEGGVICAHVGGFPRDGGTVIVRTFRRRIYETEVRITNGPKIRQAYGSTGRATFRPI